jgi:hypothetical protein
MESGVVELNGQGAMEARGTCGHQCEDGLRWGPIAQINHLGAQFGGDDRPDIVAVADDLKVREEFRDFFAALIHLGEDVLRKAGVDEPAGLEEFDDLLVVHGTGGK